MNSRIIRNALILAAVPLVTILMAYRYWGLGALSLEITALGVLTHIMAVRYCRRDLEPMLRPSRQVLLRMGAERIPAYYEPGKWNMDFRAAGLLTWAGLPVPVLAFLGRYYLERQPCIATVAQEEAGGGGLSLMLWLVIAVLVLTLVGSIALCYWFKVGQAMVVANEGSESMRYLYRAFAEKLYSRDFFIRYRLMKTE